jgi:Heparinase II/III-like protein/Heparinase II/III N-terminus
MKSIRAKLQHLLKFPPNIIVKKVYNRLVELMNRKRDRKRISETDLRTKNAPILHTGIFKISWLDTEYLDSEVFSFLTEMYKEHRFDTLGTSWIKNSYSSDSPGVEGHKYEQNLTITDFDKEGLWLAQVVNEIHLPLSQNCWKLIRATNDTYEPIDWQKDVKSGFRYDAKTWFREQRQQSDGKLGVDIKMPWELSRLQHLVRLAIHAKKNTDEEPELSKEILCQILDFIMANPIGMGVNFNCPMDVGIRNANLLLAYDLLKQLDTKGITGLDTDRLISSYIYQSTLHILGDIEYREGKTSNHYLGNVLGVLYAGLYLSSTTIVDRFLAFGIHELYSSMYRQFFEDGSNFEGSTAYHRLSGEMIGYGAVAALLTTNEQRQSALNCDLEQWNYKSPLHKPNINWLNDSQDEFWSRLKLSSQFSIDIAKENGEIPQFGDNDSGRFISFTPFGSFEQKVELVNRYEQISDSSLLPETENLYDENDLNQGGFVSSIEGLFGSLRDIPQPMFAHLEFNLFKAISEDSSLNLNGASIDRASGKKDFNSSFSKFEEWEFHKESTFDYSENSRSLKNNISSSIYPDFQLAVIKSEHAYVAVSGMSNPKQHLSLSHAHNDKGSVELVVNGQNILLDPGTYLYTPIPEQRMQFRSVTAHNTINVKGEEQNLPLQGQMGLFNMISRVKCVGLQVEENTIMVELHYGSIKHVRRVTIEDKAVKIEDWCNHEFEQNFNSLPWYSNGYGKIIER